MSYGEKINTALKIVFRTLQSVQELMEYSQTNYDHEKYFMPMDQFLRRNSETNQWSGWLCSSFILIFQRRADGEIMNHNNWINGPLYAVEINLDSFSNEKEPQIFIGRLDYGDLRMRPKGISPRSHHILYDPMHEGTCFHSMNVDDKYTYIEPNEDSKGKMKDSYWNFKSALVKSVPLVGITKENYLDTIFGSIEELAAHQ